MKSVAIRVLGKVQGVWFRASTEHKARSLQLTGWVANQQDGSVYIEAHGATAKIEEFINWCRQGPKHAIVEDVKIHSIEVSPPPSFEIKRSHS